MQEHLLSGNMVMSAAETKASRQGSLKWQPLIAEPLRNRTVAAVHFVAEQLCEPDRVSAIAQLAEKQARYFAGWGASSLARGFASTALLFLSLARSFPEQSWNEIARRHLRLACEGTHQYPLTSPALFGGSSGLALVISCFLREDQRYYNAWARLNVHLATQVLQRQWQREQHEGIATDDYDVITGASGILGYLVTIERPDDHVRAAIKKLLTYLIWLASSDTDDEPKRWFLSPVFYPTPTQLESFPDGYFNCGLAHGIPGPLAALAVAWLAGYRLAGQWEAMHSLSHWIIDHHLTDRWGLNWPSGVPLNASYAADAWRQLPPTRDAWCYGTPGIARALWLAGTALNDAVICQTAVQAIESVLLRPIGMRHIDSVTFCHGIAGLLSICLRFAHETRSQLVRDHIPQLVQQMLAEFDPHHPLGFRDLELEDNYVDDPALLTGAVGVAQVLLAASTSIEPNWDRIFLIA